MVRSDWCGSQVNGGWKSWFFGLCVCLFPLAFRTFLLNSYVYMFFLRWPLVFSLFARNQDVLFIAKAAASSDILAPPSLDSLFLSSTCCDSSTCCLLPRSVTLSHLAACITNLIMMCFSHLCFILRAASSFEDLHNADTVKSIPPAYRHRLCIQSVSCAASVTTFIYQVPDRL